jgi:hypothetical protein
MEEELAEVQVIIKIKNTQDDLSFYVKMRS